jgi:L-ascorbate metabolism protein UlaG (beta-lactamase superfamily)
MTLPLSSVLEWLRAPDARQVNDRSVFRESNARRVGLELPGGLELEWLGTAGFRLAYEGVHVLIDPYVTRPNLLRVLARQPLRPDTDRIATTIAKADAILMGHTHFDHALDAPAIAHRSGAKVYGSSSSTRLMALHGLGHLAVHVVPRTVYPIGPFEVTFVESVHSKLLAGLKVPFEGELTCDSLDDLRGSAYRCGQVYGIHIAVAGVTFYHQGSADLLDDCVIHRNVDYFLCGIAGRGFTQDYAARALSRLSPRVVVPHHFDDFFRPLGSTMGFSLNVNLGGFFDEVHRVSRDVHVCTLETLQTWKGTADQVT